MSCVPLIPWSAPIPGPAPAGSDLFRSCELADGEAVTALAWVWRGKPTYAFEGIINFSAATIEWLKNQLGLIQSTSEVETLATNVPENGGVYLVPAFAGLSAPYWSARHKG